MSTPQDRLKIFQQEQQAAERRRIFEEEERRKAAQASPQGTQEGVLQSFQTGAARGALDYVIKPVVSLADAIGSATTGDFQPLSDIAERTGRGLLNTVSAFDPTGAAYTATSTSQAPRLEELKTRAEQRLPETIKLIEKGQRVAEARPRTTVAKVAKGIGTLATAAAPAVLTGVVSGGSVPAVAATTALQSASEPENAALNVAASIVPLPIGKLAAPILRRLRAGRQEAANVIEQGIESQITGQGVVNQGEKLYTFRNMESPLEVVAETGGNTKAALGSGAEEALAMDSGNLVAPAEKKAVTDTIVAIYKAGMLSKPQTHLKNVGGTGLFQISEEVARIPAAIADIVMSLRTGRRSISGPSLAASGRSAYEAATKGVNEALQILKKGATAEEMAAMQLPQELATKSKVLNTYVNGVFRTLSAEDKIFRVYALRRSLEDRAKTTVLNEIKSGVTPKAGYRERVVELLDNPTPDMQAAALADAEIATFNNQNAVNNFLGRVRGAGIPGGKWVNFATDIMAPFVKTPTNILGRMLDYSPIGLTKGSYQTAKAILKPVFTQEQQRAFAQTFGRGALGSGLIVLGWKLQQAGLMTGLYEDETGKISRDKALGRPEGALKVGDTWHQVTGFAPLGNLMAIGASLAREYEEERKNPEDTLKKTLGIVGTAAMEQPLLQGAGNLVDALRGEKPLTQEAGNIAASFIPAVVGDVANATDPVKRQAEGFTGQIASKLPGVRSYLPVATDALGRPLPNKGPLATFLDPTKSSRQDSTPILGELLRLDMGVSKLKKAAGEPDDLYRQKLTRFGKLYQDFGNDLLNNGFYQRASDSEKRKALDMLSERVRIQINEELKKGRGAADPRMRLSAAYIMNALRKAGTR